MCFLWQSVLDKGIDFWYTKTWWINVEKSIYRGVDMIDENDKNTNECYHINVDEKTAQKGPYITIQDKLWDMPPEETENGYLILEEEDYRIYYKTESQNSKVET